MSAILSDENIFCNLIPIYSEALKKYGFNDKLTYSTKTADCDTSEKKKHKRKIIWFNPPFSLNVKTNIGKIFSSLAKNIFQKKMPYTRFSIKTRLRLVTAAWIM